MLNQQVTGNELLVARRQQDIYGIPEYIFRAWKSQMHSAKRRGIPFRFTLFEWHCWWNAALIEIGPEAVRGKRKGQFMMCRRGYAGAYEHGNVFAGTAQDNQNDMSLSVRKRRIERTDATFKANGFVRGQHLKIRGDGHPRSRAVMTPRGRFGSIALASEAYGITRQGGFFRVRRGEWSRA